MEEEKIEKRKTNYSNGLKFAVITLGGILILGGVFCLGRVSVRGNRIEDRIGLRQDIVAGREDQGFRSQTGSRPMMGQRNASRGISGEITKIDGNTISIKNDNAAYSVAVSDTTSYQKDGDIAKQSDLKVGDAISVMGQSNSQGQISAIEIVIK